MTGADGRYTIADVPAGAYLKVLAGGGGWEGGATSLSVTGGTTITYSPSVRARLVRPKGGRVTATNGASLDYGCGPDAALDQSPSARLVHRRRRRQVPDHAVAGAVDVTWFAITPTETCGDSAADATGGYRTWRPHPTAQPGADRARSARSILRRWRSSAESPHVSVGSIANDVTSTAAGSCTIRDLSVPAATDQPRLRR